MLEPILGVNVAMTKLLAWALVGLVVASAVTTGATGQDRSAQMDGGDNESAPPGGFVSSVVGMEEAAVDGTVAVARFETRFAAAETDSGRAAVVAATLNETRDEVATLEMRLATLEARRMNGTISRGWFDVETSWLLASAENQDRVLARLERAARTLPSASLRRHNASVTRIRDVRARVDGLLARERPDIHRTSFDRGFYREVAAFADRFNESARSGESGTVERFLDSERVTLVVESPGGPPAVVSFRTTDDGRIVDLRAGARPDATVRFRTDARTARRLFAAENPRRAFARALLDGEIAARGVGPANRLKWGVRSGVLRAVRAVGGLGEGVTGVV